MDGWLVSDDVILSELPSWIDRDSCTLGGIRPKKELRQLSFRCLCKNDKHGNPGGIVQVTARCKDDLPCSIGRV